MLEELWQELMTNIWFQVTLLLSIAITSNFLFSRIKQSKIIGQIVVGMILGPSVIGILGTEQLSMEMIEVFAQLGAIVLLFMIGLECNIREIFTRKSIIIAIGGVTIPWVTGFFLAELMLSDPGGSFTKFSQSMFIGAAVVATSVAIAAGVMKELGIIRSDVAKTILGAAVVDDILGMIVLAVSAGTATSGSVSVSNVSIVLISAIVFIVLGIYLGSTILSKLIAAVEERGTRRGMEESGFLLSLSLALLYAVIAEFIGISAIVGAFVAGISIEKCGYREKVMDWSFVLEAVFAPIFFLSLGILVVLDLSLEMWAFAIALTAVAMISKLLGCGIPANLMGMSKKDAVSVGVGMSPRLEVAMIIALYGLTMEIITDEIYTVIIMMGLLTAVLTPSILKRSMKDIPKDELVPTCPPPGNHHIT